jgi:DNA-binding NarL/FixJ family response regulator
MADRHQRDPQPDSAPFVGREAALAELLAALSAGPALVLVEGEAGIGKTRLVGEALGDPALAGRRVLLAACPPLSEPAPLAALVDGLRRLTASPGAARLSPLGGALRPLFPEWAAALPPPPEPAEDARATRHRVVRALDELIAALGVELVVVEDVHWADPATVEWLLSTTTTTSARSLLLTYRPADLPAGAALRRLTGRASPGLTGCRIALDPLDRAGTAALVGATFGTTAVSDAFAALLHARTGGLPLALTECLRLLAERRDIVRTEAGWARRALAELAVPATVRDSVLERVERLPPAAQRLLAAAAIVAEPADEALLTTVAGLAPAAATAGLARALAAGLLDEPSPGRIAFRHVLAADAVEQALPASQRRRLHRRAGEALRSLPHPPAARLARHFRAAGQSAAWATWAEAAAELALAAGDDRAAVSLLHDVLTGLAHPLARRVRLARKLATAAVDGRSAIGDRSALIAALRDVVADPRLPPVQRGELRLLLGRLLLWSGQMQAAYDELEAAVPDLADRPMLRCWAMLILGIPRVPDWPARRHLDWIGRGTAVIPAVAIPAERLRLKMNQATALLLLGEEAGWDVAAALPSTAATPLEQRILGFAMLNIGQCAIAWGRYGDARRRLALAGDLLRESGTWGISRTVEVASAYLDWCTGAWAGLDERAADLASDEDPDRADHRLFARLVKGLAELSCGGRRRGEHQLRFVAAAYTRRGSVDAEAALPSAALARLHLADGDIAAALVATRPTLDMIARKEVWLWATAVAPVHVEALLRSTDLAAAEDLVARFAAGIAGRDAPAPQAALATCRASLAEACGGPEAGAAAFQAAAEAWAVLPRPYDELLARERQGLALLAAGAKADGLVVLTEAQARLARLGARWDADRVARLLRQHGVEVPRPWRSGPRGYGDALSPREVEVLALVARGLTNRQVAEALFLSPKTVDYHIGRVMRKLGVTTRTAAAIAAAEAGLIETEAKPPNQAERQRTGRSPSRSRPPHPRS